jgi:hypothetical protein
MRDSQNFTIWRESDTRSLKITASCWETQAMPPLYHTQRTLKNSISIKTPTCSIRPLMKSFHSCLKLTIRNVLWKVDTDIITCYTSLQNQLCCLFAGYSIRVSLGNKASQVGLYKDTTCSSYILLIVTPIQDLHQRQNRYRSRVVVQITFCLLASPCKS